MAYISNDEIAQTNPAVLRTKQINVSMAFREKMQTLSSELFCIEEFI